MEFYTDLDERGALPDIITCRRFSLNDAAHLSDKLLDLSQTNVAGSFYDSYIENNRESSGAIRWLPMWMATLPMSVCLKKREYRCPQIMQSLQRLVVNLRSLGFDAM